MAAVMIGIDPHKGSHTAVAIGADEELLGQLRVRASSAQATSLVAWAADLTHVRLVNAGTTLFPNRSSPRSRAS